MHLQCPMSTCIASALYILHAQGGGPHFFDRVVVFGWLWLMYLACLLIAICVGGGGVAVVVPMVQLHSFSALHFKCLVNRVERFWSSCCV